MVYEDAYLHIPTHCLMRCCPMEYFKYNLERKKFKNIETDFIIEYLYKKEEDYFLLKDSPDLRNSLKKSKIKETYFKLLQKFDELNDVGIHLMNFSYKFQIINAVDFTEQQEAKIMKRLDNPFLDIWGIFVTSKNLKKIGNINCDEIYLIVTE